MKSTKRGDDRRAGSAEAYEKEDAAGRSFLLTMSCVLLRPFDSPRADRRHLVRLPTRRVIENNGYESNNGEVSTNESGCNVIRARRFLVIALLVACGIVGGLDSSAGSVMNPAEI
jgi:hypothetical protein